jgi:serine/threonine-protein kinase
MSSDDDTPTDSWPTPTDPFFTWGDEEPAPYLPRPVEPAAAVSQALVDVVRKPAPARRLPPWPRPVVAAAAAAAVTVISLIAWWALSGSGPQSDPPQANTAPTTAPGPAPTPTPPPQSQTREFDNRLMALLPAGYPPGACRQAAPPPDALSMVECGANADAPGTSARYTLFAAAQPLADAMTQLIEGMTTQICPGNYASPGPWRKTTTPEIPAGTLVCGATRQGTPSVGWTLDSAMLLAAIQGTRLDQLYTWWSTHS